MRWPLAVAFAVAGAACGDGASEPRLEPDTHGSPWSDVSAPGDSGRHDAADADTAGVHARMDFTRPDFFAAPFPSVELLSRGSALDGFPNPDQVAYVDRLVQLAAELPGFGTTSPIYFTLDGDIDPSSLPDVFASVAGDASVFLVPVSGPSERRERTPIDVRFVADGGPHGAANLLSVLPYQGFPLRPATRYAAVVTTLVRDPDGAPMGVSPTVRALRDGAPIPGVDATSAVAYREALAEVERVGLEGAAVAAIAAFTTQDPTAQLRDAVGQLSGQSAVSMSAPLTLSEVYEAFCVYHGEADVAVFQRGSPPFDAGGGEWVRDERGLVRQGTESANVWVTVPRAPMPEQGFPVVVFVRTGGGGDRPLVDRGVRPEAGAATEPGTGPAMRLAEVGIAGVSVDGPHGGLRNVTQRDEQLLVFNFQNPVAMRDNIRQSALELALVPELLDRLEVPADSCPNAASPGSVARFDPERIALMGHSMGATIAPLTAAVQPRYRALVLSGAGGSWIANVVHKRSPIPVRPIAELLLGYAPGGLSEHDPALALLQWGGESADPPAYAHLLVRSPPDGHAPRDVLMFQGITDTYILPPIANAMSLALGLDLGGPGIESSDPESAVFAPLAPLLALGGRATRELPVRDNAGPTGDAVTAVVVQHREDGVEDGHEIMFQLDSAQRQYVQFLASWARGDAVVVP